MTTTLIAEQVPCALCGKPLEYAEQFECSTCDRTVCRDCSNQHTLSPVVRCKACLAAMTAKRYTAPLFNGRAWEKATVAADTPGQALATIQQTAQSMNFTVLSLHEGWSCEGPDLLPATLATTDKVVCEACGTLFKPSEGYYEAEIEPTYSYCRDCCHW